MRAPSETVEPGKGRVEAFSDGVYAIIITIMVLELKIPDVLAERFDAHAFAEIGPRLAVYAMSFLVIAIMWVNHHALTATLRRAEPSFLWLNNLLLFGTSLIPLVTDFFGEHPLSPAATASYGAVLSLTAWTFTWIRFWLMQRETQDLALRAFHRRVMWKSVIGASVYSLSVPLAFWTPYAAMACFVLVPAMFFIPDGATAKLARAQQP